jgi:hypothetical protein
MTDSHSIVALLQAAQAVAVASADHATGDYLVRGAIAIILGLQGWMLRTINSTRDEVRTISVALFGRRGDNGIERAVEEHGAELTDHDRRISDSEGRLDRIDPDARLGPLGGRRP